MLGKSQGVSIVLYVWVPCTQNVEANVFFYVYCTVQGTRALVPGILLCGLDVTVTVPVTVLSTISKPVALSSSSERVLGSAFYFVVEVGRNRSCTHFVLIVPLCRAKQRQRLYKTIKYRK